MESAAGAGSQTDAAIECGISPEIRNGKVEYAAAGAPKAILSRPSLLRPALPAALAITGDMSPLREGIFGHSMDEYSHVSFVDLSGILKDDTAPRRKLTAMHCQESAKQASRLFCRSPGHGHWPSRALVRNSSVAFRNQSVLSGLALEEFPCRFRLLEDSRTAGCTPG